MRNQSNPSKRFLDSQSLIKSPKAMNKKKNIFLFALAAIAFLFMANLMIKSAVNYLLVETAQTNGMDWAHQIESQVPMISGERDGSIIPDPKSLKSLANSMIAVGNIFQIDIINPDCYCDISFIKNPHSEHALQLHHDNDSEGTHSHDHDAAKTNMPLTPKTVDHIFNNEKNHDAMPSKVEDSPFITVKRETAQFIAQTLRHDIYIKQSANLKQPSTYGEVFLPVSLNGELTYIIRILVDLEEEKQLYMAVIYGAAIFVLILLLVVFAYPTHKYFKISKAQKNADRMAHFLANHDIMTGINNRNSFQQIAPEILKRNYDNNRKVVFVHFDSDNFKRINDTYGHDVGDALLRQFALQLKEHLVDIGIAVRFGGDEFIAIIENLEDDNVNLESLIGLSQLQEVSIEKNGENISMHMSAGHAVYPDDGKNLKEILRNCDLAMYAAKKLETGSKRYSKEMGEVFYKRTELCYEFKLAIENQELVPFYQPLVNVVNGELEGFEALVRWNHPTKGVLAPFHFEEMLTHSEYGRAITWAMLKNIVKDIKVWKANGVQFKTVSLNVGEVDLLNPNFAKEVLAYLLKHNISPHHLAIEITETFMIDKRNSLFIKHLDILRNAGCKISLDDFGTGYSSITQIKDIPFSVLKIDKSFIDKIVEDGADQAIVSALVGLGKELDFKILCEGVETLEQLELLKTKGCGLVQGYLYSQPIPASMASQFVTDMIEGNVLLKPTALVA